MLASLADYERLGLAFAGSLTRSVDLFVQDAERPLRILASKHRVLHSLSSLNLLLNFNVDLMRVFNVGFQGLHHRQNVLGSAVGYVWLVLGRVPASMLVELQSQKFR